MCGVYLFRIVASLIAGYTFVIPVSKWSPSWWFQRLVSQGRYIFCFSAYFNKDEVLNLESITVGDGFLAFLTGTAIFSRWLPCYNFTELHYDMQ